MGPAEYRALYADPEQAVRRQPEIAESYLSRDRRSVLFEITPAHGAAVKDIEQLARDLAHMAPAGPFRVLIGGDAADHNDFSDAMFRSFPIVFGFVIGATLLLLFAAFRSYLLPFAAVLTNLLAVAAGYGVIVSVFEHGWLNGLIGLERPFVAIPLEVPLMVFCLSFGFSCFAFNRSFSWTGTTILPRSGDWPPWRPSSPARGSSWPWFSGPSSVPRCPCSK
jgi:uncharacterized membrane protein YdfJ with MMPL/SSD domain